MWTHALTHICAFMQVHAHTQIILYSDSDGYIKQDSAYCFHWNGDFHTLRPQGDVIEGESIWFRSACVRPCASVFIARKHIKKQNTSFI